MKMVRVLSIVVSVFGLLVMGSLRAEDIDIYVANSGTTGVPNVLFAYDNAASFSASATNTCTYSGTTNEAPSLGNTAGGVQQCALYNVIYGLTADSVNIGLMIYNENGRVDYQGNSCGTNANGGCLVVPLSPMDATTKSRILEWIKGWSTSGSNGPLSGGVIKPYVIKGNTQRTGAIMQEAWAYYSGLTGLSGRNYSSIQPPAGCQRNFVVFVGNAFENNTTPSDGGSASILQSLTDAGASSAQTSAITIPTGTYGASNFTCGSYSMPSHTDSSGLYADEWARFMKNSDVFSGTSGNQGITSYTIGLLGSSCKPDYPALLTSMAKYGGGKYFATSNYDELKTAIQRILNEVQAVNSVFASATLPVSVNAQGTYLNQIFLGMFRPDPYALPRWVGNLKQYQFALSYPDPTKPDPNTASLILADAQDPPQPAISSAGTGFIAPDAVSFWTYKDTANAPDDATTGGFYKNDSRGAGGVYDKADGEQVDKGGVGQQIRTLVLKTDYSSTPSGPRKVYTYCPSGSSCNGNLTNVAANVFSTDNAAISDTLLNSQSSVAVSSLTRSGTTATVVTSSAHGFAVGDTIRVSGANENEYNGTQTVLALDATSPATKFTFTTVEYPPVTAVGTYTASRPSSPISVTSLTRSGGTVTATTSANHGYVNGNQITIAGATPSSYNGAFTISAASGNTFQYTVTETPVSPAGGGTATVGSTVRTIEAWNANPTPGVVRNTGSTTVSITTTANHGFANTGTVTLSNVADSTGSIITTYTGSFAYTKTGNKTLTITLPSGALGPATPATGTITADLTNAKSISSLTRAGTTATAVTSVAHGFTTGQAIDIGGTVGTNESAYAGTKTISVVNTTTFTYTVSVSPTSPATGSMAVAKFGTSDRTTLINWVRGHDNYGDEAGPGSGVTVRPSVHGDVLHSRPVVINYGDTSRGTVVFYGTNDGHFRAINGSQSTSLTNWDGTTVSGGGELWSLILPEHFSKLNRLRVNTPELRFATTVLPSALPKDYFIDGPTGVYQLLNSDGTINKAILYLTMRRGTATDGSRFMYALDVSTPTRPVVLWRISSAVSGFSELGQTWSRPRVTLLQGYKNTGSDTTHSVGNSGTITVKSGDYIPVLVFGGGYDPKQDTDPPTSADTQGRSVYFVHAITGTLIWRFEPSCTSPTSTCTSVSGLNFSIPSELTFSDRDNNGLTDKMYVGDMGGNLWRLDVADASPANWTMRRLAALGCDDGAPTGSPATKCTQVATMVGATATMNTLTTAQAPRKFFFPPAVLQVGAMGASGSYDAIMVGSGDREHPLYVSAASSVQNRLFFVKDAGTAVGGAGATTGITAFTASAALSSLNLVNATSFGSSVSYDGSLSGYYINLSAAEKSVNAPVTVYGTTYFGTNKPATPSATQCTANLGEARGYALNPFTGQFNSNLFDGGGLPPSPVAGLVTISYRDGNNISHSLLRKFCIGCAGSPPVAGGTPPASCNSALQNCLPDQGITGSLKRTYWYTK